MARQLPANASGMGDGERLFHPLGGLLRFRDLFEGARKSKPLDLSTRNVATTRPSPSQAAEARARFEYEAKVQALQRELDAMTAARKTKEVGKAKYLRRMARGKQ